MFVVRIPLPCLVYLRFPVCQGDSAALKMSEGALSSLSRDITAVKSLSTQTNLQRVSYILSTHSTAAPQETRRRRII